MPNSKQVIRKGYNRISFSYRNDQGQGEDAKQMIPWLREVDRLLKRRSQVLELGCGMGVPVGKFMAARHHYLGVDLSDVQIRRAKKLVPRGRFLRGDMSRLRFKPSTFDVVLSFYAIIHLPLREQKPLIKRIFKWLKPGGIFEAVLGWGRWTGKENNWFGAEMFWSHTDQGTYRRWLEEAGFQILRKPLIREGKGGHVLFVCRKKLLPTL